MSEPLDSREPPKPGQPSVSGKSPNKRPKPPGPIRRALGRVPSWLIALILCAPALALTAMDSVHAGWKLTGDVLLLIALLFSGAIHRGRWTHMWGVLGWALGGFLIFNAIVSAVVLLPTGGQQRLASLLSPLLGHAEYGWLMDCVLIVLCLGLAEMRQSGRRSRRAFFLMLWASIGISALILLAHELLFRSGVLAAEPGWDGMGRYRWVAPSFAALRAAIVWWLIPLAVRAARAERPVVRRAIGWLSLGAMAGFVALFAFGGPALPPQGITVSTETTVVTGPINADGTVNYVEAINIEQAKGVTAENNAAVPLVYAAGEGDSGCGSHLDDVGFDRAMARLGMAPPPAKGRRLLFPAEFETMLAFERPATRPATHRIGPQASEQLRELIRKVLTGESFEMPENLRKELNDLGRHMRPNGEQSTLSKSVAKARDGPWSRDDFPRVAAWLEANAVPLARVLEASKRDRYYFPLLSRPDPTDWLRVRVSLVGLTMEAGRALAARAMLRAGENDLQRAWADILAVYRLARLLSGRRYLVEGLVGIALEGVAAKTTHALITSGTLDARTASACLKQLRALGPLPGIDSAMQSERYLGLDGIMALYRGDQGKPMAARLFRDRVNWDEVLRITNLWNDLGVSSPEPRRDQDRQRIEANRRRFHRIRSQYGGFPEVALPLARSLVRVLVGGPRGTRVELAKISAMGVNLILVPATDYGYLVSAKSRARGALARIELALEAYRLEKGRLPKTLGALVPDYLSALPTDELTGHPLKYEVRDDGTFLLTTTKWQWGVDVLDDIGLGEKAEPSTRSKGSSE